MAQPTWLGIRDIIVSEEFQMREKLCRNTVAEYAELIRNCETDWPFSSPCSVFRLPDTRLVLVDGFHRVAAVEKAGEDQVKVIVHNGSRTDALVAALSANNSHGLRRTNNDKRRAVKCALSDKVLGKLSDREIADKCGVSHPFVAAVRAEVVTVTTSAPSEQSNVGSDGKSYPANKAASLTQRQKIEVAILAEPDLSDREIAKIVGCDGKTVGTVRKSLNCAVAVDAPSEVDTPEELDDQACDDSGGYLEDDDDGPRDLIEIYAELIEAIRTHLYEFPEQHRASLWQQAVEKINCEDVPKW